MTFNIPERNRAIKSLLLRTYPGTNISVKAGNGTAYRWVYIEFKRPVEKPPGKKSLSFSDGIVSLIEDAGIYISKFNADDMGGERMLPCVSIKVPRAAP